MSEFGEKLLAWRTSRKNPRVSREKFRDLTGLSTARIDAIEKGKRDATPEEEALINAAVHKWDHPDVAYVESVRDAVQQVVADAPALPDVPNFVTGGLGGTWVGPSFAEDDDEDEDEVWTPGETFTRQIEVEPASPAAGEGEPATSGAAAVLPGRETGQGAPPVPPEPAISNSEIQSFKRCRRKWWLGYYRELGLKQGEVVGARSIGTRVHRALAAWYRPERMNPYEILVSDLAADLSLFPGRESELRKEVELCQIMLEGYFAWITETGQDEGLEILGDEQVVTAHVAVDGRPVAVRARLDVEVRRKIDGAQLFIDHKTVGDLTTPVRTLHMDEQMLMYMLLQYLAQVEAGVDGARADGGLYNMLRKVKRTASANPPFYDRVEVRHGMTELRSFYTRLAGELSEMLRARQLLDSGLEHRFVAYPSPRSACTWDCDFFPVCPMFDDGSNAEGMLEQLYEHVDPYARYDDVKGEA